MKGYYRDPETTASRMSRHGFHTGDYAYTDAQGFLYYQGRRDNMFKSAGKKVSAREIEDVVLAHDSVAEAAVIAMPDPVLGTVPVVYVVRRTGTSCTDRELQTFCAPPTFRGTRFRAPCISSTSCTRRRAVKFRSTTQGAADMTIAPLSLVGKTVAVPWGCWDPDTTLELSFPQRFTMQVNEMRDGRQLSAPALANAVRQPLDSPATS